MVRQCVLLLIGAWPAELVAQEGMIAGVVRDSAGAPVVAAAVRARMSGGGARVAETDALGRYRLAGLVPGRWWVTASGLGYAPDTSTVALRPGEPVKLDFGLAAAAVSLGQLDVIASRERERFASEAGLTVQRLGRGQIEHLPGLAEADVLRAVQALPGVVTTSDFSSAYHVRGGSADENLIELDGFPIFNPFHLGGLFGLFDADMVADAELLAGGFPASYGGRVSSVLSIDSDAGRKPSGVEGSAGLSLLGSRLGLGAELPAGLTRALGMSSARVHTSVRRSYFDALLRPIADFPYHLTDVQGYFEGWTPGGGRLTLTGYTGGDVLDFARAHETFPLHFRMGWGNDVLGAHWTGGWGGGRSLELRAGYSRFQAAIAFPDYSDTRMESRIGQGLLRADARAPLGSALALEWGVGADALGARTLARTGGSDFRNVAESGWQGSGYAQLRWRAGAWLTEAGMRADGWYPRSRSALWLGSPRLALKRFLAGGDAALNLSFGRFTQIVQSVRNEEIPVGIDLWQLAGAHMPAVISDQVQGGIESFRPAGWHLSLEAYDRRFRGVVAENPGADPNDPGQQLIVGSGRSYGADLLIKRERGPVTGWLSASWLRATRSFPDVLSGAVPAPRISYPPLFDRRLDVELVLHYPLPAGVEGGVRGSYGSGLPYTRPTAEYDLSNVNVWTGVRSLPVSPPDSGAMAVVLGAPNGARYPVYFRLDASFRRDVRERWGVLSPYLDILNVTNRRNVLFYFYQYDRNPPRRSGVSMFPILPTVGVEVTF